MKSIFILALLGVMSCTNKNESLVREHLEKSMKLSTSNLEISSIEIGDEKKPETANDKAALALLGLKDSSTYPVVVTFKAKERCVAIADAIKGSMFSERKVACRPIEAGKEPNLKYVKGYLNVGFRQIVDYADGKIIEAGSEFKASGELVFLTATTGATDSTTYFRKLD